ncbi:MAG TPA: SDR family NAD(P)-dependent oxidoreductase [Trebonia sp.]|nr:SDR family NAD(P)-dependent oxidoreductase [Trebonia sp.]
MGGITLVTGAAQGIGLAIARRLAADGATVAVNDKQPTAALDELAASTGGIAAPADVSDREQVAGLVARTGPVQTLVCNAAYMTMSPLADHQASDWWKVIDTNLTGTFHLIQAVLPGMRELGGGRIVIVTSYWGVTGWPNATAYAASKAGLIALTKTLGRELAPEQIIVNAVAPGVIATPQLEVDARDAGVSVEEVQRRYAQHIPLGRVGRAEEIADAVAFLASPKVGAMVGQILQVNGGEIRCRA